LWTVEYNERKICWFYSKPIENWEYVTKNEQEIIEGKKEWEISIEED
jgi:hypothetical protein